MVRDGAEHLEALIYRPNERDTSVHMDEKRFGSLRVRILPSPEELADTAAGHFAAAVNDRLAKRDEASVILSKGGSQTEFVRAVRERGDIDWSRITVFHANEYYGVPRDHHASARRWFDEHLLAHVRPKAFHGLGADHHPIEPEIRRYNDLLERCGPVVAVTNIGESGHLAFNDPPADFHTRERVRIVALTEEDRRQQVKEGHFPSLEETPELALTVTLHGLLDPPTVLVITAGARKAKAVRRAVRGPVTPDCPASALTTCSSATLYLDDASASLLVEPGAR